MKSNVLIEISKFIEKHRVNKDVNFLFTLGKYSKEFGFEKNILHRSSYLKIENLLNSCSSWDSIENKNEYEYEGDHEILDDLILLCKNGSYDIQLTAELNLNFFNTSTKNYTIKNHVFILSTVTTIVDKFFYDFILLAIIPEDYTDIYISESSLLKIIDILNIINPSSEFNFVIVNKVT